LVGPLFPFAGVAELVNAAASRAVVLAGICGFESHRPHYRFYPCKPLFIEGLRHATAHQKFQITTDGFAPYVHSISDTLADRVSFAQLIKVYRAPSEGEGRYSPAEVASVEVVPVMGNPDPARICTSHIERQNLTIRMQMRRLTRLTNAFSKKWENLWAAYCLHFAWYNFGRIHRSIRVTPAMEAGITDHVWELKELLA
jgi:hypothetical protein